MPQAHPGQAGQVTRHLVDRRLADLGPPLTHEGHHPHQGVGIERSGLGVVTGLFEGDREHAAHPFGHIAQQAGEIAAAGGDGSVVGQGLAPRPLADQVRRHQLGFGIERGPAPEVPHPGAVIGLTNAAALLGDEAPDLIELELTAFDAPDSLV
jgi:hypothetical protein